MARTSATRTPTASASSFTHRPTPITRAASSGTPASRSRCSARLRTATTRSTSNLGSSPAAISSAPRRRRRRRPRRRRPRPRRRHPCPRRRRPRRRRPCPTFLKLQTKRPARRHHPHALARVERAPIRHHALAHTHSRTHHTPLHPWRPSPLYCAWSSRPLQLGEEARRARQSRPTWQQPRRRCGRQSSFSSRLLRARRYPREPLARPTSA